MIVFVIGLALAASAADLDLTAKNAEPPRTVDAGRGYVFGFNWRQPVVTTGFDRKVYATFGQPAVSVHHGVIIVGTGEGRVNAYAMHDGSLAWTYDHGAPFEASVSLFQLDGRGFAPNELAVLAGRDGQLLALEAGTGKLVWKVGIEAESRAPATRLGDVIFVTTAGNQVFALELATGKQRWRSGRPAAQGLTVVGHSRATLVDGTIYAGFSDGYVEAFDAADGARKWSRPLSIKGGDFVDADADPVLVNGVLVVASYSDGVYGLDPANGETRWMRPAPAVSSLGANANTVLAGSGDGWVFGLDAASGDSRFRTRLDKGMVSRLEVREDLAVLAGGTSGLVVLDARSGRPLQASGYGTRLQGDPRWERDEVAVLSSSGYLYAFSRDKQGSDKRW